MRSTQVAIIGAGPSGLLLSQLLHRSGIDSIVLERHSREHVQGRVRAGLLEWSTVEVLQQAGVGERMMREGLIHDGINLAFADGYVRIDLKALTGRSVFVYGQTEIQKDLADARAIEPDAVLWEASDVVLEDWDTSQPAVSYTHRGSRHELHCDFIAGCDGYHGISRITVPYERRSQYERIYPFGWLGVLVDVPPLNDELVYANHERGFALCSMRSHSRSRYYIQCALEDRVEEWSDDRFWTELYQRLPACFARQLITGPAIEKSIAPLRSFVVEPMRFGRLFLVGDAAHIVPPIGAKGLNLAVADVRLLSHALVEFYRAGATAPLDAYSAQALDRVWKAMRFSWWYTILMHRCSDDPFARRLQLAELRYIAQSQAAARAMAENYVGLGFTGAPASRLDANAGDA